MATGEAHLPPASSGDTQATIVAKQTLNSRLARWPVYKPQECTTFQWNER